MTKRRSAAASGLVQVKVDCATFYPEMQPRLECGGVFVPFSYPPGGSVVGWCMFCGAQYYVPGPSDKAEDRP
jgi:hypothetical protein